MVSRDYGESPQGQDACPRCGEGRMRIWYELTDDEREVVKRLPASADMTLEERAARRQWCTRCWHEESGTRPHSA